MNVVASAVAPAGTTPLAGAFAHAVGINVTNVPTVTPTGGGGFTTAGNPVSGTITNAGTINVVANAAGGTFTTPTVGGGTTTLGRSSATATGIHVAGGANTMTISNSGSLNVDAITANNGVSTARGIFVEANGAFTPAATDVLTINNSGDIIVRQSIDGGATWTRGMAIDVASAGEPTVINLLGGNIYGNIDNNAGDDINVTTGTTYFDGIINPEFLPAGGVTEADLDSGLAGEGTLTISGGGNLILADPRITGDPTMYDGPAYAFVDTLTVDADGTLTYELQPAAGGTQPVGTYPQIFTNTANLAGTLVADVTPAGGLFADSYTWENVIDATAPLNGTFDQCVLDGAYAGSLLLDFGCSYDATNVDLTLTRTAFNAVPGLNRNGIAVGTGLECIYDVGLTGGVASMLGDLFLFTDQANYNIALNQLSGSVYANYLNSFPSLGVHQNDLVDHATNCEIPALAGSVLECRVSPIHVWGQLDYQTRKADGDVEAGDSRSKRFTGLLGIDASVGNAAIIGGDIGYLSNHFRDHQFGDHAEGNGWTGGVYGVYDPGAFYVKALATYSSLNGDSRRNIDFTGLAPGATFASRPTGDPDVKMWTFGLHGGARLPMGATSVFTPYLNYDYVNAKLDGFIEDNGGGAGLTVEGSRSKHSFLTGGVKWATQIGGVVPEVNLGYRHRFGNKRSTIGAFFNGDTDCDFDVISAAQKSGTFLAGLSIGGKLGPVDVRVGYEGEFNGDIRSHSGNFKLVLPIGGHAAPPPPPPPPLRRRRLRWSRSRLRRLRPRRPRRLRRRSNAASAASKITRAGAPTLPPGLWKQSFNYPRRGKQFPLLLSWGRAGLFFRP